jgi:hypothetical protein
MGVGQKISPSKKIIMQVTYEMPVDCSEHKEEWWEQGQ